MQHIKSLSGCSKNYMGAQMGHEANTTAHQRANPSATMQPIQLQLKKACMNGYVDRSWINDCCSETKLPEIKMFVFQMQGDPQTSNSVGKMYLPPFHSMIRLKCRTEVCFFIGCTFSTTSHPIRGKEEVYFLFIAL